MASKSFVRRARAAVALGLVLGACTLAVGATPASAGLGITCPGSTVTPFAPWSDYANYAFVPNGGFEAGAAGWSLSGALVVPGNEGFFVHSTADRYALSLPAGSSATTPPMCISLLSSKMRFVVKRSRGAPQVKVQVLYRGVVSSLLGVFDGGTVTPSGSWSPSPQLGMLGGVLPLLTASVQFRFVVSGGAATIDDVYLDPMKSS